MSELSSDHLEGLKQLVDEHRRLNEENQALTQVNQLLTQRLEEIRNATRAILALSSNLGEVQTLAELPAIFKQTTEVPPFSVRLYNCIKNYGVQTVGELVRKTEDEVYASKNFGRRSFNEMKSVLATQNLHLGMTEAEMVAWVPPNPEQPLFTSL